MNGKRKNLIFSRRLTLTLLGGLLIAPKAFAQVAAHRLPLTSFAPVVPGYTLRFPHDEGSHPEFRTEWWYVTGWLNTPDGKPLGFQITFFRTRLEPQGENPSAFAPRQILIAHAALSDPERGRLQHDQRVARAGFTLAGAGQGQLEVWIDEWSLKQEGRAYRAHIPASDFKFDFTFSPTQPPLLQGSNGLSRKGPKPEAASYYYSLPQLGVNGTLTRNNKAENVAGTAWLDHEWSSSYMDKEAAGWDWAGINFADGGALMVFRMRDKQDGALWAGGTLRAADGRVRAMDPADIRFTPLRFWRSPRTGANYPVSWQIRAGPLQLRLEPLLDDQELDTRLSTGTIYWEGAVRALHNDRPVGQGYLELTGYWRPMYF